MVGSPDSAPCNQDGPEKSFTMPVGWMQSSSALLVQDGDWTKDRAVSPGMDSASTIVGKVWWFLTGQLAYLSPVRLLGFDMIQLEITPRVKCGMVLN